MAMGTAFGQGKNDNTPPSVPKLSDLVNIVEDDEVEDDEPVPDPNAEGFDLVKYVDNYIKEHWVAPAPQGEFETTKEYYARVVEEKDKQKRELMNEVLKKLYGDNPFHEKICLKFGQYNIYKGYFPMATNGFGTYALSTNKEYGRWWRDLWDEGKFYVVSTYGLVNGKLRLVYLAAGPKRNCDKKIYPIDEITGELDEFIWENGAWNSRKEMERKREEIKRKQEDIERKQYFNQPGLNKYDELKKMPSFKGNINKWLSANIIYPFRARENGIQGRVSVSFVVEKDGSITNVKVTQSEDPLFDKEAVRVVKSMPKWKPGKLKGGKPARVLVTLPFNFRL